MGFPPPPNTHALAVLLLTVVALVLFTREKIPLESSSLLILMTLAEALQKVDGAMKVKTIERGPDNFLVPLPDVVLKAGDHLIIRDTPDRLKEFEKVLGGTLYSSDAMDAPVDDEHP
jgi:uncharacterized protein with PhoU and TrkA domain